MLKAFLPFASCALVLAACSSSKSSGETPSDGGTHGGEGLHVGVTSASMTCDVGSGSAGANVDLSCSVRADGPSPPPTLRLALVWRGDAQTADAVVELGEQSTTTGFHLPLAVPPASAIWPASGPGTVSVGVGQYVLYDDGNGNGALDLSTAATASPDRVLALARHLILYYPDTTSFQIEESTPMPAPEDCVAAPCFTPVDHGSALMGPGTKIELVPIGPVTSKQSLCRPMMFDSAYEEVGSTGVPPNCSAGAPPAGSGIICQYDGAGDILVARSMPPLGACGTFRSCDWCIIPAGTFDAHPESSPCNAALRQDGGFE
jgi:hypothetical protein